MFTMDDINYVCNNNNVIKTRCLPNQQASNTSKLSGDEIIEKDILKSNVKAVFNGKLTTDQMLMKMKGCRLDVRAICDMSCDFYDYKESDRRHWMTVLGEFYKNGFVSQDEIKAAFDEVVEYASDFIPDCPHAYLYIGQYFGEYIKISVIKKIYGIFLFCRIR
jgi:hypothetical protein